jgi:serine/threonine protein kinase
MHEFSKTIIYSDPRLLNKEIKAPDYQCDIYSFGLTIWEIYSGQFPYFNKQLHQSDKIQTINELFEYILFKCTTSKMQQRYKNLKELINDLSRWKEVANKSLENKSDKKDDLFKLGHFEDLFLMARELRKALHEATEGTKIKSNRIDGKFIEKKEKYRNSNDNAYITFDYDGIVFGINGDSYLEAIYVLVEELEKSISFSLMNPEEVFFIEHGKNGERTKLKLRVNYDVVEGKFRANGFYCYEIKNN